MSWQAETIYYAIRHLNNNRKLALNLQCKTKCNLRELAAKMELHVPRCSFLVCYILCLPVLGSITHFEEDANTFSDAILNTLESSKKYDVSTLCKTHIDDYLQGLTNFTPWAVKMFSSSSNFLKVITDGDTQELGNYDQCLSVKVKKNNNITDFNGQLCKISFQLKEQIDSNDDLEEFFEGIVKTTNSEADKQFTFALCSPSTCSLSDVQTLVVSMFHTVNIGGNFSLNAIDCPSPVLSDFTTVDIAIISLIAVFSILITTGTIYDIFKLAPNNNKGFIHNLLASFSIYSNGKTLLDTSRKSDSITCVHGLRFLTILWILLGHTIYMDSITPHINKIFFKLVDQGVTNMIVMNATLTTDTFFLLSGTLLCYIFLRKTEKITFCNTLYLYLYRYIRLTPPYAFMIFFYATLFPRLGSGPLWTSQVAMASEYCVDNWWTNLMYINNYIHVDRMCMIQSWYLSVDMQLFWVSPLFLYPLVKTPFYGKILLGLACIISLIIPMTITIVRHLPATMLYTKDVLLVAEVYLLIYTRTYARAGPYLIGIALGYLLHSIKGKAIMIPKIYVFIGWLMSAATCLTVLLGVAIFYGDLHEYNVIESSIYAGFHRPAWALGIAWVIFACVSGYGAPVDTFLSWKLFLPLSRLTYCIYLCHYVILLYKTGNTRTNSYLSAFYTMHDFAGNILLSTMLAAMISLTFEMPFINLIKIPYRKNDEDANGPESRAVKELADSGNPPESHENMAYEKSEDGVPS